MTNQVPNCAQQSSLAVPPTSESASADLHPLRPKWCQHTRPQGPKLRCRFTRPPNAEHLVQSEFPIQLHLIGARRPTPVPSLGEMILHPFPGFARVRPSDMRKAEYPHHG